MITTLSGVTAPSFDHPLEMLRACHGKILRQCDTLQKLAAHLEHKGCDQQVQQAAQGILRYFDTAGQFHHLDEEQDLFPALRAAAGADNLTLDALLERLLAEHVFMLAAWEALHPVLSKLAEGNHAALTADLSGNFIRRYTDHIAIENAELLPLAARLLDPLQMELIGRRMAERRGAKFPA
ncbi:MAG: hemerythrin domain-containing protein [Gallionella sp.]|nr:hemerythrin domain-containing protein [Gallionella sp.]MDP1941832.1 hemerythrin domain-containing protein [Gallionella sp.]